MDITLSGGDLDVVLEVLDELVSDIDHSLVNDFETGLLLSEVCSEVSVLLHCRSSVDLVFAQDDYGVIL
jgi:hypothetical protein